MILQLFLGLVLIAVLFFIIGQEKRRRIWSVLLFGAVLGLLYSHQHHTSEMSDTCLRYRDNELYTHIVADVASAYK